MHRYAVCTAVCTFLLLIAGGLVTSTGSGLAVPDWPLSYGTWWPPMVGGIRYEHSHRMMAAVVGLLIVALAAWCWYMEPRRWVRRLSYAALAAVLLQGLLGGLTVLLLLPPTVSILHACLGQTVFCLVVSLAVCTSPQWGGGTDCSGEGVHRLQWLVPTVFGFAAGQLILGAVMRHTGQALALHIAGAAALLVMTGWLARQTVRVKIDRALSSAIWRLLGLIIGQVMLGAVVLGHRMGVVPRTAHVALGALVLAQAMALTWETFRRSPASLHAGWECWRERLSDYLQLAKARLSALVLATTAVGFWMGLRSTEPSGRLWDVLLGTALVVGGSNALNEWWERMPDARMHRTRHRPLPAGRLSPAAALRFGLGCTAMGVVVLAVAVNGLAALLAAAGAVSYVLCYTPLKRRTPLCTLVGAVPGALPPLIGWAGARGTLGIEAWALGAILFLWQLPHFLALALVHQDDYARAGFRMLPLMASDGLAASRQILLYGTALLFASLFPALIGLAGYTYGGGAMLLGAGFLAVAARAAQHGSARSARALFLASVVYLPLVLGLLALDRTPAGATVSRGNARLPEHGAVPAFSLRDQQGRSCTREDLAGRVWVADFIFTRCAGQCPILTTQLGQLQTAFDDVADLQLVSFSVDPEHDTPEALAAYAAQYGARAERWRLLTGPPGAVAALAQDGFRLGVGEDGSPQEPITHSVRLTLVDRRGRIRGYYDATDQAAMGRLLRDARRLLRAP